MRLRTLIGAAALATATLLGTVVTATLASAAPAAPSTTRPAKHPAAPSAAINDLARTPYQGWNTYYGLGSSFDAKTIEAEADALVSRGLAAAGYNYVWIDGGWWSGTRDSSGNITVSASQWPDGMKAVADYVHSKGLKVGIYTDAGSDGCGGTNQGSYGRYQQDVNQFAGWGYDAVKVDFCGGENLKLDPSVAYGQFRDALLNNSSHRPMLLNICNPFVPYTGAAPGRSAYDSWTFGPTTGNSWRTDTDIGFVRNVQYSDMLRNLDDDAKHPEAAGPGHWNDPDYLAPELGFSTAEAQTQFSMWSMAAAPLIIGSDVRALSAQSISMLTNREVLAVDQDPLGRQGTPIVTSNGTQVWTKPLANGDVAVALFNRGETAARIATSAQQIGLRPAVGYTERDLWQHTSTETAGRIVAAVAPHSVALLRISRGADLLTGTPAVSLSPATVPATYPGSDLNLAVPGRPITVSAGFENDGIQPLLNVRLSLTAPAGWKVSPAATSNLGTFGPNRTVTQNWQVTPAAGALPGPGDLTVKASYQWVTLNPRSRPALQSHSAIATNATAVLVPSAPPAGATTLSEDTWLRGTSGYLVPRLNQEVAGGGLVMNGVSYPKGIGTASPSVIDYYVGGNCTTLTATVGIDDSAGFDQTGGTATFQVLGDGKTLYDSGLVTRPAVKTVTADVTGAQVISLVVGDGGDGGYNDRADWGGLNLTCGAAVPTVPAGPWPHFVAPADQVATASSANDGYPAGNAADGDLTTIWHSQFSPVHDPLPISYTVDLKTSRTVTGLTYQPRLDGDNTGIITGYRLETSTDGVSFIPAGSAGTWAGNSSLKSAAVTATTARYVRLVATDGVNGYASAAEIRISTVPVA